MSYPNLRMNLPPGTPQRPLPGAFLQTPAPTQNVPTAPQSRPVPAQGPAYAQAQAQAQTQIPLPRMAPAVTQISNRALTVEERGAHTINNTLAQEARYPDLDSYLSRKWDLFSALQCIPANVKQRDSRPIMISLSPNHGPPSRK